MWLIRVLKTSLAGLMLVASISAYGHKVNLFAYVDGDRVAVDGYFSDGKKALNSAVVVYGPDNQVLLSGTTDDAGAYSFPIPQKTDLRITLNAGLGHQTEYLIPAAELGGAATVAGAPAVPADGESVVQPGAEVVSPGGVETGAGTLVGHDPKQPAQLEAMIRKAVAEAVAPLARELKAYQDRASFTQIIGGIGYILGLLGVGAYFQARRLVGDNTYKKHRENTST